MCLFLTTIERSLLPLCWVPTGNCEVRIFSANTTTMRLQIGLLLLLFSSVLPAQRQDNALSQDLQWRNIGPANMMGRIAAVDALNTDYRHVLCASASGGVFKSTNGGITWEAIFDRYGAGSIGSVALNQSNPDIIWVGTGESANRNSSGWGDGIYRSTNGGKTFQHLGLTNTHHVAEIALHPNDENTAYAAAVGHLWGYGGERGLYKTTDGGQSWEKLTNGLPDDGKTGCTEIILHPDDPNTLFAGFYHRLREPYWYTSGGEQGGLFKSTDGGETWEKLTNGLPTGDLGMIDLSICLSQPNIIVGAIETDENLPEGVPGSGVYRSDDGGENWQFLHKHAVRPFYHGQIEIDPLNPDNIYVVSRDFQLSRDGGQTFERRRWYTDGGDDHDMWIAPYDSNIMYLCTDQGLRLSVDGGQTVLSFNNMAIGQFYAIGVDMRDPYHIGGGLQDNGLWLTPSQSREVRGILNGHNTWVGEGDGFHYQIDPTNWRTQYVVNHVGFAARVDLLTRDITYITPTTETIVNFAEYFDPNFPGEMIRYTIYPGEHWFYYEYNDRPKLPAQFRFNWSSPLVLSPNNSQTVYFAGNHLFKSIDRGGSWRIISPDLTSNNPAHRDPSDSGYLTNSVTGGENFYTIVTVAESVINSDLIWVGSDDGLIHVTTNGGTSWTKVSTNLPRENQGIWVSRVEPSKFVEGRCYITLDNHRQDDMQPYVFRTDDFGATWVDITANLPGDFSTYVIREDYENPNLLFVGTEEAVHFSYNGGEEWHELMANMPTVAIHDLVIHPREGDLIAGTHGRSIWIMDDISPLRQLNETVLEQPVHLFESRRSTRWLSYFTGRKQPHFEFRGENAAPGAAIHVYLNEADTNLVVRVEDVFSGDAKQWKIAGEAGINRTHWDMSFPPSTEAISRMRANLMAAQVVLDRRIENKVLHDSLSMIGTDLRAAGNEPEALNDIRRRMVTNFAGYALGRPLFGEYLEDRQAPAGRYRVLIQQERNRAVLTGWLEIREDPLRE